MKATSQHAGKKYTKKGFDKTKDTIYIKIRKEEIMYIKVIDNIPYEDGGMLAYGKDYREEIYVLNITDEGVIILPAPNLKEKEYQNGTSTDRKTKD